jgi:hypothetical protein
MTMSRRTIIADAMRSDVFVYLAGPITPQDGFTLADNVQQALEVFCHLLRRGIPAFCPHLTASEFDLDYETWLAYDLAVLARCTHVMLLPRWASSPGAVQERAFALSRSIPLVESILSLEQVLPARRPDGALL